MSCEFVSGNGALFAVWGTPTCEDVDRLLQELFECEAREGAPIVYVTRVPVDAPAPDSKVRAYLTGHMPRVVDCCDSYHVILEGDGFGAAVKRAVLLSLFQIRWRHGTFYVHSSVEDVLSKVRPALRARAKLVLDRAAAMQLTVGPGPR